MFVLLMLLAFTAFALGALFGFLLAMECEARERAAKGGRP